jgi:hypothetical protein
MVIKKEVLKIVRAKNRSQLVICYDFYVSYKYVFIDIFI